MRTLETVNKITQEWKKRNIYIKGDKDTSLHTTWRARVFTKKGKSAGFPEHWRKFNSFKEEMSEGWKEGLILIRLDNTKPFSKENCFWGEKGTESLSRLIKLEYRGEEKTLVEWSIELNINYNAIRQRYHRGKNYSPEQILFGKKHKYKNEIIDYHQLPDEQKKRNKISKMLSAYRHRDKVKGLEFSLTREFMVNNIINKPCFYCGDTTNIGCDRINNKVGHTADNVLPVCYTCNMTRSHLFTVDEMKKIGKVIRQIKEERKNG